MTKILLSILAAATLAVACSRTTSHAAAKVDPATAQTFEVGCAGCVFQMPGAEGCQLAVKAGDKIHLVSGVEMPGHESGLCDHSRMASLNGKMEGDRYVATAMELKP